MRKTFIGLLLLSAAMAAPLPRAALADPCPGNDDAIGTSRVLSVTAADTPRVGRKQFRDTLQLAPGEIVLTFDDGPWPATTPRVLTALAHECVKATFFMLGSHAQASPQLAKRVLAEGHTVGHHTYGHPLLNRMPPARAEAEIDRGIAAVNAALYGRLSPEPLTPFFRFPGFASSPLLLDRLAARRTVVFGTDVWASDWVPMSPQYELDLLMSRLRAAKKGIVLLHDTKAQTAAMLPEFLRALKDDGYRIVHVVPARPPAATH